MGEGNLTILVVDDESAVRRLVEQMLKQAGYRVCSAGSAGEALAVLERLGGVNLLVTDIVMPGTDGHQLIGTIRQIYPHVRTMAISGFVQKDAPDRDYRVLMKPFTGDQLLAAVKQVLDGQN